MEIRYPPAWLAMPSSADEAKRLGLPQYFPPEACTKCNCRSPRYVAGKKCSSCKSVENSKRDRSALSRRQKEIGTEGAFAERTMQRKSRTGYTPEVLHAHRARRKTRGAEQYSLLIDRRPPNQSDEDRASLQARYAEAKARGESVDHQPVPFLGHPLIGGLHVPGNTTVASLADNKRAPRRIVVSDAEAATLVEQRLAVWMADVGPDGKVDWSKYPWATS